MLDDMGEKMRIQEKEQHLDFENVLFRWKYFNKTDNPANEEIENYRSVIKEATRSVFASFGTSLKAAGIEIEDLRSIASIHIVSYIGLFSLSNNEKKKQEFCDFFEKKNGRPPLMSDIDQKDKSNAYFFLKQRLLENASQYKNRSMKIYGANKQTRYFIGNEKNTISAERFIKKAEKLGFIEISESEAKTLVDKLPKEGVVKTKYGQMLRTVNYYTVSPKNDKTYFDIFLSSNQNNSPEKLLMRKELESQIEEFENLSNTMKIKTLKKFLNKHKNCDILRKEVSIAKKMLKQIVDKE
jgi:hypothetical protein